MSQVVLYIASSLDGYIARPEGDVDWLFHDQDYGYSEFISRVGTVVMGRVTYEQILTFGEYPYPGTTGYVLSRTKAGERDENVQFLAGDLSKLVAEWKAESDKNIWLVGGGQVVREFLLHDVIDEFVLSFQPVLLGKGMPLFPPPTPQLSLTLVDSHAYDSGLVQLTYRRTRQPG